MRRTQIYLPDNFHALATRQAKRRRVTLSFVVRERLGLEPKPKQPADARDFFEQLAALGKTLDWTKAPKDLSQNIDDYLYGDKSKHARRR